MSAIYMMKGALLSHHLLGLGVQKELITGEKLTKEYLTMSNLKKFVTFLDFIIYGSILVGVYFSGVAVSYKVKGLSISTSVLTVVCYMFVVLTVVHLISRDRDGKA
jgi:hypothetical protein